jgi:integrase
MQRIRSNSGGVTAKGHERIQFDFVLDGVRYRPSIKRKPTDANLQRALEQLQIIRERIRAGTFRFENEFPSFRDLDKVVDPSQIRTCNQVFDQFVKHCEARVSRNDFAPVTLSSYRQILDGVWRPKIGGKIFLRIDYLTLARIADENTWSKKRYNNAISVLRRAFVFGYRSHPQHLNPALGLKCGRMARQDRPRPDPFRIQDAETLIAQIHADWGEAQGYYHEFRFFTGLRPSEQIALIVSDFDVSRGTLSVTKARVDGIDKNTTKTREGRLFELCPRAVAVLKRQLKVREDLQRVGKIDHEKIFFSENGQPFRDIDDPGSRWSLSLAKLPIRHRRPYCARHSSVSWNLMIGKNPLWVARQHGHSTRTMLEIYAAWAEGAVESDIETIRRSMGFANATMPVSTPTGAVVHPDTRTALSHNPQSRAPFSIWHWIWHQKRSACA